MSGSCEAGGRLAHGASGEQEAVAKRCLAINQDDLDGPAHAKVLESVVEDEGVGAEILYGVDAAFDAVAVDEDTDAWEVVGEHEGLIACNSGVQE